MSEAPKRIKRAMRDLAGAAYEIELGRALTDLHGQFKRWERGEITPFDLSEAIHAFHQGPARDLYVAYTGGALELPVAHAIVTGMLDRSKIEPDVLAHLGPAIARMKSQGSSR